MACAIGSSARASQTRRDFPVAAFAGRGLRPLSLVGARPIGSLRVPRMFDAYKTELAGRAGDAQWLFHRIEHADAFGIEHVRANQILTGQQLERRKLDAE